MSKRETTTRELLVRLNNWSDFYNVASWFLNEESTWVFRGHEDSKWKLKSTWDRFGESCKKPYFKSTSTKVDVMLAEYFNFRAENQAEFSQKEKHMIAQFKQMIKWDHNLGDETLPYLMAMQHYGIPTRLLDFTYSLFTALYFAYERSEEPARESEPERAIWAVRLDNIMSWLRQYCKTDGENRVMKECDLMVLAESFLIGKPKTGIRKGVVPIGYATNSRMVAQRGLFLMPFSKMSFEENLNAILKYNPFKLHNTPKNKGVTLNEFLGIDNKSNIQVIKFVFAKEMRSKARMVLEQAGIDEMSIYPDKGEDVGKMKRIGRSLKYRFVKNLV